MTHKYLFLYSGGNAPQSPAEGKALMDAWMAYFGKIGPHIVDGGAPLASGSHLLGTAAHSHASGYSIVSAESMEAALALTQGHPHVAQGGGIEVFQISPMPGM